MGTITETYMQKKQVSTSCTSIKFDHGVQMHVIVGCIMMNVAGMMNDYALEMPEHHNPTPLKKSRPEILM